MLAPTICHRTRHSIIIIRYIHSPKDITTIKHISLNWPKIIQARIILLSEITCISIPLDSERNRKIKTGFAVQYFKITSWKTLSIETHCVCWWPLCFSCNRKPIASDICSVARSSHISLNHFPMKFHIVSIRTGRRFVFWVTYCISNVFSSFFFSVLLMLWLLKSWNRTNRWKNSDIMRERRLSFNMFRSMQPEQFVSLKGYGI